MLDTGIFQHNSGLRLADFLLATNVDMLNKGNLAENFAGLEMIKYMDVHEKKQLYYWHRENRGSSAEVDYLLAQNGHVVPIEIKSGSSGKMQSLHLFLKEKNAAKGIRVSLENFSRYDNIEVVPLYEISNLIE